MYGPNSGTRRVNFWEELDFIVDSWDGPWCVGGKWNVIRFPSEKLGGCRITPNMQQFSDRINSNSIINLHLSRAAFTWSNLQRSPLMSKLDRFLVSMHWLELYLIVSQVAFPKPASVHCPILLDSRFDTWGPAPFRFELMWLEGKHFSDIV